MSYTFSVENLEATYPEMEALYRAHYAEMCERLNGQGVPTSPYKPRLDRYFAANREGYLIHYVLRHDGEAVGYSNIYLTNDMHNGEFIAREDTIFVRKDHRKGIGRKLSQFILSDLRSRGVMKLHVTAVTDLRVSKLWERMGFKHVAHAMTYTF